MGGNDLPLEMAMLSESMQHFLADRIGLSRVLGELLSGRWMALTFQIDGEGVEDGKESQGIALRTTHGVVDCC